MTLDTVRLPYYGTCDWEAALSFLSRRAIDGVEQVESGIYQRTIAYGEVSGMLCIAHEAEHRALVATVRGPSALTSVVTERVRRMFDLDADADAIAAHLARDPAITPLVVGRPALRVYRGWDGFEVAVRSIIGQQVTVERARRLNGVLVDRCNVPLSSDADEGPCRLFPTPQQVLNAELSNMGMPGARVAAIAAVARAAIADPR